jgi:peptidoglycan/xylan/chitin deacetylase (PgdA/CDA1 family)
MTIKHRARQLWLSLLHLRRVRNAAIGLPFAQQHSLVLLYHRVADGSAADEIVPSLPVSLFTHQLQLLAQIGEIVPLSRLLEPPAAGRGPRFALTFDDDHACYRRHVLPVLQALQAPATFFLSGRTLHGLGPYWWSDLEHAVRTRGLQATCRALAIEAGTMTELALAVERTPHLPRQLSDLLAAPDDPPMAAADIEALADAGMTIGFHTLHHPVLTALDEAALVAALVDGRRELAEAAGVPVDFLAYPHGRANHAVAAAAERVGFGAAFTTREQAITERSDRFLLGRWDPHFLTGDDFAAAVALRLLRPATAPRRAAV